MGHRETLNFTACNLTDDVIYNWAQPAFDSPMKFEKVIQKSFTVDFCLGFREIFGQLMYTWFQYCQKFVLNRNDTRVVQKNSKIDELQYFFCNMSTSL